MDIALLDINLQLVQNQDLPKPEESINYATGSNSIVDIENKNQNIENKEKTAEIIPNHLPKETESRDELIEQQDYNKRLGLCNFKGFEIVPNNNKDKIVIKLTNSEKKTLSNVEDNVNRKKKKRKKKIEKPRETEVIHTEKVNENGLMDVEIVYVNCNPSSYYLDECADLEETEGTIAKRTSRRKRKETLKLQEMKKDLIKNDRNPLKTKCRKPKNDKQRLYDRLKKREKRQDAAYKERERERDKIKQRIKRADLDYRMQERIKDRERKRTQSSLKKLKTILESAT